MRVLSQINKYQQKTKAKKQTNKQTKTKCGAALLGLAKSV